MRDFILLECSTITQPLCLQDICINTHKIVKMTPDVKRGETQIELDTGLILFANVGLEDILHSICEGKEW